MKTRRILIVSLFLFGSLSVSVAQTYSPNVITTTVPFLTNALDSRGTALGFGGVATSPDAFSMFYNPAKYAFMKNDHTMIASGFNAINYMVPDQYALFDAFAQKIGRSAIAATVRYYAGGEMEIRDAYNQSLGVAKPMEFAIDLAYSRRFGDYLSAGLAGRFIYSGLTVESLGYSAKSYSVACDVSAYYQRPLGSLVDLSAGAAITNIGTKMAYVTSEDQKGFIPTTLRLGTAFKFNIHPKNTLTVNLEFNKLLVPTPPIFARDDYGNPMYNNDGSYQILHGMDNNVSVFRGMFQSFYDAPGYALNAMGKYERVGSFYEEMCEINTCLGLEYNLADHFFIRTGYYHVPALKGGVDCLTEGLGMKFGIFGMDLSYSWYIFNRTSPFAASSRLRWDMYFAF